MARPADEPYSTQLECGAVALAAGRSRGGRMRVVNVTRGTEVADRVQLAGDGRSRRKGLLGRKSLQCGEGLWIVPCESVHTFWMQFPIDLIYLDRKHRVLKVRTHVRPWRMSACLRAHSVIELASGTVCETGTMPGDILTLE